MATEKGNVEQILTCSEHSGKSLELFCTKCDNQPICVKCVLGKHKGHSFEDIASLPETEKKKLVGKLETLAKIKRMIAKDRKEMEETLAKFEETEKMLDDLSNRGDSIAERVEALSDVEQATTIYREIDPLIEKVKKDFPQMKKELEKSKSGTVLKW